MDDVPSGSPKPLTFKNTTTREKVMLVCVLVAIVIMGFVFYKSSNTNSTPQAQQPQDESSMAYIASQEYVKQALKSPASAKFPLFANTTKDSAKQNVYSVSAYVDSQNSFSALLRSNWTAQVLFKGGEDANPNNWELQSLIIDGKVMYSK